jgi:hypothetical protein
VSGRGDRRLPVAIPPGKPVSPIDPERLERAVGAPLPAGYRAFVAHHDGAEPADNIVRFSDVHGPQASGVRAFLPVSDAPRLMRAFEGWPRGFIPLAEDGCGNYFLVSLTTGAVHFLDHETDAPPTELAPDIPTFLGLLEPFDPASVQVSPEDVTSVWIHPDFEKETGMKPRKR